MYLLIEREDSISNGLVIGLKAKAPDLTVLCLDPNSESEFSMTLFEFMLGWQQSGQDRESPLLYSKLNMPSSWNIDTAMNIRDFGTPKGIIELWDNDEKKWVKSVTWLDQNQARHKKDYYNLQGKRFKSLFLSDGKPDLAEYYSPDQRSMISYHIPNDACFIQKEGKLVSYSFSYQDFMKQALQEVLISGDKLLIWPEQIRERLPELKEENGTVEVCPRLYEPVNKEKRQAQDILILTNSDQLEKIDSLVEELKDFHFHIAARTMVSDRIHKLEEKENVSVHAGIGNLQIKELLQKSSFYFDINHYDEVSDIVNQAVQNDLLAFSFKETAHNFNVELEECCFAAADAKELIDLAKACLDRNTYQAYLDKQRLKWEKQIHDLYI